MAERLKFESGEGERETELSHHLVAASESVASEKHPERNEDSFLARKDIGVFGVFDGVGGHAAGEKASQAARESFSAFFEEHRHDVPKEMWLELLRSVFVKASAALESLRAEYAGGKPDTTASVTKIVQEGERFYLVYGHAGDSRIYVASKRALRQVTKDDDIVSQMPGISEEERERVVEMLGRAETREDLKQTIPSGYPLSFFFSHRNVIERALSDCGKKEIQCGIVPLEKGELVLLTSDGIHDNLTTEEIAGYADPAKSSEEVARSLVTAAQTRAREGTPKHLRAKHDDMTALAIEIK